MSFIPSQQAGVPHLRHPPGRRLRPRLRELGQRGAADFTVSIVLGHRRVGLVDQPQGLGQPAGIRQQALGLLGHVALLQMVDERGPVAGALADRLKDAGLMTRPR